jgi:hypothetical protein
MLLYKWVILFHKGEKQGLTLVHTTLKESLDLASKVETLEEHQALEKIN